MRLAFVLDDERRPDLTRFLRGLARELGSLGHEVELVLGTGAAPPPFAGHTALPPGTSTLAQAVAARRPFDVAVASSWRAVYLAAALDTAACAHLVTRGGWPPVGRRALIERSLREPDVALLALGERARTWIAAELGREAPLVPPGVEGGEPRDLASGPLRVAVIAEGDPLARSIAVAQRVRGVEIWAAGEGARDGATRAIASLTPESLPALLRTCGVLLDLSGEATLLGLEMMAQGGAVVAASDDEAVRALEQLRDDVSLRERLARENRELAARADLASSARALAAALEGGPRWPSWRRAELAAAGELLTAPPAVPARPDPWAIGLRVARRVLRRWARGPGVPPPPPPPPAPPPGPPRPGEPVLFVGQAAYFRSVWHDALVDGWGAAAPIEPGSHALNDLPERAARAGARTCVVFQPELLAPRTFTALKARGVRMVAYTTEPVPRDGQRDVHWDQVRRLDALRPARRLAWDLVVHFDPASAGTLRHEGFGPVVAHPLPVSAAIFHPETVAADFDVCLLGWSTPHREAFLAPLRARYRTLHVAHGAFDEEARRLMNRSRLVLNLHAHDYPSFENRCAQALFCGRPLVSEPLSNRLLTAGEDFLAAATPEELLEHARALLDDGAPPPRPTFARARFLAASLRDLLAEP